MDSARELFEHELRDIYDAENKLVNALESMASKVSNQDLANSFKEHREVTRAQAERLEQVFALVDRAPRREPCKGINGLIEEFTSFVKEEDPAEPILDVFATGAALKVEHYEIAAYKSLIGLADQLGLADGAQLLQQNLNEELETAQEMESMSAKLGQEIG